MGGHGLRVLRRSTLTPSLSQRERDARLRLAPAVVLLAALALAGCGKKGNPVAPGPADQIIYPHVYPSL